MLLPLLGKLDSSFSGEENSLSQAAGSLIDAFGFSSDPTVIIGFIGIFFVLKGGLLFAADAYKEKLRADLNRMLRTKLNYLYMHMRLDYYSDQGMGHFLNVTQTQQVRFVVAAQSFFSMGAAFVASMTYAAMAMLVSWQFGLMAIALGLFVASVFTHLRSRVKVYSRQVTSQMGRFTGSVIEALHTYKYLLATAQTSIFSRKVEATIEVLHDLEYRMGLITAFVAKVREPIAVISVLGLIVVYLNLFNEPLAPIFVSLLLFYRSLNSILSLQSLWQSFLTGLGSVEAVHNEFETLAKWQEDDVESVNARAANWLGTNLRLENVSFCYGAAQPLVLNSISLTIPANQTVAFVGESGAGKSTLVDIITRSHIPVRGRLLIGDQEASHIPLKDWRNVIGYVSQDAVIFDDSISNNITMWDDTACDPEKLVAAAKQAQIHTWIESLECGYQTQVGERGIKLSGGQKQRLFIARELYRRPRLLILDEATSALDSLSESLVQQSIDEIRGSTTVIIIAHRLSTVRNVDKIFVLRGGVIVEEGSFMELVSNDASHFRKLAAMQGLV